MVKTRLVNDRIHVDTPYDEGFVQELKNNVPSSLREWDGDKWVVHPDYGDEIERLINKYFQHRGLTLDRGDIDIHSSVDIWYDDYHFRSKTEARWAYFFNEVMDESSWRYEPNLYNVDGELYLPDFYLVENEVFVEIKGKQPSEKARHHATILSEKEDPVVIFCGPPYKIDNEKSVVYENGRAYWGIGLKAGITGIEVNPNGNGNLSTEIEEAFSSTKGHRFI
jgi:hypothetical protein